MPKCRGDDLERAGEVRLQTGVELCPADSKSAGPLQIGQLLLEELQALGGFGVLLQATWFTGPMDCSRPCSVSTV